MIPENVKKINLSLFVPKNITFGNITTQNYRTYLPVCACTECPPWARVTLLRLALSYPVVPLRSAHKPIPQYLTKMVSVCCNQNQIKICESNYPFWYSISAGLVNEENNVLGTVLSDIASADFLKL